MYSSSCYGPQLGWCWNVITGYTGTLCLHRWHCHSTHSWDIMLPDCSPKFILMLTSTPLPYVPFQGFDPAWNIFLRLQINSNQYYVCVRLFCFLLVCSVSPLDMGSTWYLHQLSSFALTVVHPPRGDDCHSSLHLKAVKTERPVFAYMLPYIVGFGLFEMVISTNPKPAIYRNLYYNTTGD